MADSYLIEGIELNDLWIDRDMDWTGVKSEPIHALEGTLYVYDRNEDGESLDIIGNANRGLLTRSVMQQLKDLAKVKNATYTLTMNSVDYTFRFRNEDFPPVEGDKIETRTEPSDSDSFNNIRIKIMIME